MAEKVGSTDPNVLRRLLLEFLDATIGASWRAATSDGQGAYLLAMVLFGIAAFSFHYALIPQTTRELHLERNASNRQESLRGESFPVLAGLVLPQSYPAFCRDEPEAKQLRAELQKAYKEFTNRAEQRYQDAANIVETPPACHNLATMNAPAQTEISVWPHKLQLRAACESQSANLGPAWTDNAARSLLFVPSITAATANSSCSALCKPHAEECFCAAYDRLLADHAGEVASSLALEDTSDQLLGRSGPDNLKRTSAYFISSQGITRSVPKHQDGPITAPAHSMNNGTSYFFNAMLYRDASDACLEKRSPDDSKARRIGDLSAAETLHGYITYPYLDSSGNGLVETYCATIDVASDTQHPANTTIGVLCTDIAHPESKIIEGLIAATRALDLSVVRIYEPPAGASDDPMIKLCNDIGECNPALTRLDETRLDLFAFANMYYKRQLQTGVHGLRTGGVFTNPKMFDLFAVSVFRGSNYWDVAVGRLRQARRQDHAALVLCGLCIALAVSVLVISSRRKTMRREAYLTRGLTFGIVQVNNADEIVGGNDRAEAILGTPLPALGIEHDRGARRSGRLLERITSFSSYIDKPRCVLIPFSVKPDEECIVPYNYVRWRSIEGLTTNFYVWLLDGGWIRATARVVVLPDGTENLFYVLNTHICSEHAAILEKAKQLHARRPSENANQITGEP